MSDDERCPRCNRRVRSVQIDETEERVLVDRKSVYVAIRVPGCIGYTTTHAARVHQCPRKRWP